MPGHQQRLQLRAVRRLILAVRAAEHDRRIRRGMMEAERLHRAVVDVDVVGRLARRALEERDQRDRLLVDDAGRRRAEPVLDRGEEPGSRRRRDRARRWEEGARAAHERQRVGAPESERNTDAEKDEGQQKDGRAPAGEWVGRATGPPPATSRGFRPRRSRASAPRARGPSTTTGGREHGRVQRRGSPRNSSSWRVTHPRLGNAFELVVSPRPSTRSRADARAAGR